MDDSSRGAGNRKAVAAVMLGLAAWGLVLALGAFLFSREPDWRKPLIVVGCAAAFLAAWGLLLWSKKKRR